MSPDYTYPDVPQSLKTNNAGVVLETPAGTAQVLEVPMHRQSTATQVQIYTLSDPDSGIVRYVGQSANPALRLKRHLRSAGVAAPHNAALCAWLLELRTAGKQPILRIVQTVPPHLAFAAESAQIAAHARRGASLVNISGAKLTAMEVAINGLQAEYARMTLVAAPALVALAEERSCSIAEVLCQVMTQTLENMGLAHPPRTHDDVTTVDHGGQ